MTGGIPIACDLSALSADERERRRQLAARFYKAFVGRRELADGYALKIGAGKISNDELNEWSKLEGKCCPFLRFAMVERHGAIWLHLTGAIGVKEFLKTEMGA